MRPIRSFALLLVLVALAACAATPPNRVVRRGFIRVSTDGSGRVVSALILTPIHPKIDETVTAYALAHWRGPANSSKDVPITYSVAGDSNAAPEVKPTDTSIKTNL